MARSPIELLGAVLDEVEGIRQTDKRSHLPKMLMLELNEAIAPPGGRSALGGGTCLTDAEQLVGETITQVFEGDLRDGDILILCESGAFLVLEAENDGDSATINTLTRRSSTTTHGLKDYLRPSGLESAGVITRAERMEAERQDRIKDAERMLARAQAQVNTAQATLDRMRAPAP